MATLRTITDREQRELDAANASGRRPIVFIHGLWLHASSWDPWRRYFEDAGYATLAPGWPGDPETVADARRRPEALAGVGVAAATTHYATIIRQLKRPPVLIGHSFGGLIVQKLLGLGLGAGGVAIDPAPFRGVLPVPLSSLKVAFTVLKSPANRKRAVSLTRDEFRYGFANAVPEDMANELYERFAIPAPGRPLFQAATANLDPGTEASVDTRSAKRGPLLLISGDQDHTVPFKVTHAAYEKQKRSRSVTELETFPNRGHSLTIDPGWRELAEHARSFFSRNAL
jgi:non-heme chloroperoxidase